MKKISKKKSLFLVFILLLYSLPAFGFNGFSDEFTDKFRTCTTYKQENTLNNKGTVYNDMKFFIKENNNTCRYYQVISNPYGTITIICKFNKKQIAALYNTMKLNNPEYQYSYKAESLWNTYINNKNICTIDKKTFSDKKLLVPDEYLPMSIKNKY